MVRFSSVQFSRSVVSDSLQPHESQHATHPCPSPIPGVYSNSCPWSGDAIQPSHFLSSPSPPAPNPSQRQGLFQWVNSLLLLLLSRFSHVRLCDPMEGSPPGSAVPGVLQARTLEWVAISFSYAWKWKVKVKPLSHVQLLGTPWTAAYQAPLSMGFSSQEYWSGLPLPSPQLVTWGGQRIGVSASTSVFPMNTHDWSPLGWTSWVSLQSKGLSRVFSNTTVQKH